MIVITSVRQMQSRAQALASQGMKIGLVPTMGALHDGHLSLIGRARKENDIVIASIFVNPAQFGPNEDYLRYPRPFLKDKRLCAAAGVDFIFHPPVKEMYPDGYSTYINVEKISGGLCGASRPGHFRGVATVVSKLFSITCPSNAYFGLKDYQQLKVIERLSADLNIPVTIVPCPIVREPSGLARSSRNQYLSARERQDASGIYRALLAARDSLRGKKRIDAKRTKNNIVRAIREIPGSRIDYVHVGDADTLESAGTLVPPVVIAVAVWVGKTRLIDNIVIG